MFVLFGAAEGEGEKRERRRRGEKEEREMHTYISTYVHAIIKGKREKGERRAVGRLLRST